MGRIPQMTLALLAVLALAPAVSAQAEDAPGEAYFTAVAEFFGMPLVEVDILRDSRLPADEIPVVLFFASRAGVSPEALLGLRRSGSAWTEISRRYGVGADALHVPLADAAAAGPLETLYAAYRSTPVAEWRGIRLNDRDIVVLVNVRVLSQTLDLTPAAVLARAGETTSFVELYASLIR